ncbi:hypothetical protein [Robbsia sp. KACC 23696]|uniref:hypothetical protein n=1 Tax=Robbsia sp. KACC 23696 TaxID=3149231 RepID=UPI00325ABE67
MSDSISAGLMTSQVFAAFGGDLIEDTSSVKVAAAPAASGFSQSEQTDLTRSLVLTDGENRTASALRALPTSLEDGIFTIGFCGTGSNARDAGTDKNYFNGEMVSTLLRHTAGNEFVNKLTVDGPGSGNLMAGHAFATFSKHHDVVAQLTGRGLEQHAAHAMQVLVGKSARQFGDEPALQPTGFTAMTTLLGERLGALIGLGTTAQDIAEARAQIQGLEAMIRDNRDHPIHRVNVVAWSRGSACAHIFAHLLNDNPTLRDIEVRLVCIDPVAGPGNHSANVLTVPSNVREAVYYTAEDERSFFFETFHVRRQSIENTRTSFHRVSGNHAMVVGNITALPGTPEVATAVAETMRMCVADQLRQWGSDIRETVEGSATRIAKMDTQRLVEMKALIREGKQGGAFAPLHQTGYAAGLTHAEKKIWVTETGYAVQSDDALSRSTIVNDAMAASMLPFADETPVPWLHSVAAKVWTGIKSVANTIGSWLSAPFGSWGARTL